ncbi:glycine zipper domain-containing protein [Shewanella carassii]|uniref:Lipoprotein YfgH n=1 Tax=Shewanella carassii TaxID=1987584 RepID=A0ABQ1SZD9_9GAMM|nr:hypothetical protein [Shewanella carassii]BCV65367.1 putative lipoprotein YfgH [Shewanella carassii]GGE72496.1 putative lipoprotein YfgH [Shewanella carassii]
MKKSIISALIIASFSLIGGCQSTGEEFRSDSYTTEQVNTAIEARTVEIITTIPAKVAVDNTEGQKQAKSAGMLLGAIVGAAIGSTNDSQSAAIGGLAGGAAGHVSGNLVDNKVMVDGVQITYRQEVIEDLEDVVDGKRVTQAVKHMKTFISAQVGRSCEYQPGVALLVQTVKGNTRIQPNAACPKPKEG